MAERLCTKCAAAGHMKCLAMEGSNFCAFCEDGLPCPMAKRTAPPSASTCRGDFGTVPGTIESKLCACQPHCTARPRKNSIYAHGHKPKPKATTEGEKILDAHLAEEAAPLSGTPAVSAPIGQALEQEVEERILGKELKSGMRVQVMTPAQYDRIYRPRRYANPEVMEIFDLMDSIDFGSCAVITPKAGDTVGALKDRIEKTFKNYGHLRSYDLKLSQDGTNGYVVAAKLQREAVGTKANAVHA